MPRKKAPKSCEFIHNQKGLIVKVLVPFDVLQQEYGTDLLAESPLFQVFQYIEEYNDEKE